MDVPRPTSSARASSSQQSLWVLHKLQHPATYTVALPLQLTPDSDLDALARAIGRVVGRHEALRTTLRSSPTGLVQDIWPEVHVPLVRHACGSQAWPSAAQAALAVPFDLGTPPLLRAHVYTSPAETVLVLLAHHVVVDGVSEGILWGDLAAFYLEETSGRPAALATMDLQYADYAEWQQSSTIDAASLRFWRDTLADAPTPSGLSTDWLRGSDASGRAAERVCALPRALSMAVRERARLEGTTPFLVLLSAFAATVARLSGAGDLVIGTPVSGRDRPELAGIVGCFINTVPLRFALDLAATGRGLLTHVRQNTTAAFFHQHVPFNQIMALQEGASRSQTPQLFFAHRVVVRGPWEALGWRALPFALPEPHAKFELSITVGDDGQDLRVIATYQEALYEPATIDACLDAFALAIDGLTSGPDTPVRDWPVMAGDRLRAVLRTHTATPPSIGLVDTIVDQRAAEQPEAVAVVCGDTPLTYGSLHRRAHAVARSLGNDGGRVVGVWADRTADYVVGIYGVLASGAAYLPLDPTYPTERLDAMLADAGVRTIVGPPAAGAWRAAHAGLAWIDVTQTGEAAGSWTPTRPRDPDDLAYVLYTSGSTGRPKGVGVAHRNIVPLVMDADALALAPSDRVLHLSRDTFDFSTFEIWAPLMRGGRTVLSPEIAPTSQELGALIRDHGITVFAPSASYFNLIVDADPDVLAPVQRIFIGAEALSVAHVRRARERLPRVRMFNAYGPTETTVFSTTYEIPANVDSSWRSIPIGGAIPHTRVVVVDPSGHVLPTGAVGELLIGGAGVSRGYLNRPEETAAAFVRGAVRDAADSLWYRTGDYARVRASGALEYLGRHDGQVKLRGQRIELGEVEAVLRDVPGVSDAAAAVKADDQGRAHLVGYVVASPDAAEPALRRACSARLPDYMVPARVLAVAGLPRSAHGKLDRGALPTPSRPPADHGDSPRTDTERRLCALFSRLLKVEPVDASADFFRLGGHSLLAVQLVRDIEETFAVRLPLRRVWEDAGVRAMAAAIDAESPTVAAPGLLVHLRVGGQGAPLFIPHGLGGTLLADPLVDAIDIRHPVFGIATVAEVVQDDLAAVAEAMAERLSAAWAGPIALAGYSFAGILAYEVAVALRSRGRPVALVAVVDTGPGRAPTEARRARDAVHAIRNAPSWVRDAVIAVPREELALKIRRKSRAAWQRVGALAGVGRASAEAALFGEMFAGDSTAEQYRDLFEAHLRALMAWLPRRLPGDLLLLRARTRPLLHSFEPDLGWQKHVEGRVDVVTVPGTHDTVMKRPNVGAVAHAINERLARLR